jgi:hypothetical protein
MYGKRDVQEDKIKGERWFSEPGSAGEAEELEILVQW